MNKEELEKARLAIELYKKKEAALAAKAGSDKKQAAEKPQEATQPQKENKQPAPPQKAMPPKKEAGKQTAPAKQPEKPKPSDEPKKQKPKKLKKTSYETKKLFENLIRVAGIEQDFSEINKKIIFGAGVGTFAITAYLVARFIIEGTFVSDAVKFLLSVWVLGFIGFFLLIWLGFFFYVDLKIYKRRKEIEEVFPDYLQLTAANINAGMPIDRALWFAIRPRFGILAKEMEDVAKATMVGGHLSTALQDFSAKYDSVVIERALNLLLEGLESGGEVGDLLSKVADNIRETEILKKEMAANVTTYVIFILFATLGAAPFLFGLTTQLVTIMKSILGNIQIGDTGSSMGSVGGMMTISAESIEVSDYKIFAIASLVITATFASILISIIQKGNANEAVKRAPVYIAIALANYFAAVTFLGFFLGGFFT